MAFPRRYRHIYRRLGNALAAESRVRWRSTETAPAADERNGRCGGGASGDELSDYVSDDRLSDCISDDWLSDHIRDGSHMYSQGSERGLGAQHDQQ